MPADDFGAVREAGAATPAPVSPADSKLQRDRISIEDRVQVINPTPGERGAVLEIGRDHSLVEWDVDGSHSWALTELLEVVED